MRSDAPFGAYLSGGVESISSRHDDGKTSDGADTNIRSRVSGTEILRAEVLARVVAERFSTGSSRTNC